MQEPSYLPLFRTGNLEERAVQLAALLEDCTLCPRQCQVNRREGEYGFCRTGARAQVASFGPHFGEEAELVGKGGSGTIFMAHCNLACSFCQNHEISQCDQRQEVTDDELAEMMLSLQRRGCHNINIVTPTHVVPQVVTALAIAAQQGLSIPLVYNSGGYDSADTLRLLDGIVDIYMPDAKYGDNAVAQDLSHAPDYVPVMEAALREMHRQVGDLETGNAVATRGMIIRHLVLPGDLAGTRKVMEFIAQEISRDSYVNVMAQYHPAWLADLPAAKNPRYSALLRPITSTEYRMALRYARKAGLHRGF